MTEAGYRVIAPDWIGAGYSDHPRVDAALTLAHHIADLVSLIDQLDIFLKFHQFTIISRTERIGRRLNKLLTLLLSYVRRRSSIKVAWRTILKIPRKTFSVGEIKNARGLSTIEDNCPANVIRRPSLRIIATGRQRFVEKTFVARVERLP